MIVDSISLKLDSLMDFNILVFHRLNKLTSVTMLADQRVSAQRLDELRSTYLVKVEIAKGLQR